MNVVSLAVASIRSRPLHAGLCMMATAAGIALLCAVFLLSQGVSAGFMRNAQDIDIVAGPKGSPLQLILSTVYHADIPAGNIDMAEYEKLKRHPRIRQAIPLALGDSYKGYRMVGTTPDYLSLYKAEFKDGRVFSAPYETVAGADTGLNVGDEFAVSHGFSANSDDVHDYQLYTVTGVLKPTGTVLDKLFTTRVDSVQQLHAHHEDHHEEHAHHHKDSPEEEAMAHQVTAVILKVSSPVDLMNLPRQINQNSHIMAAVPSYEIARFMRSLGIGKTLITVLAIGFITLAGLMLLASLASGMALRRYDLAVLRVLGASPARLAGTVMAEGLILSSCGALLGIILGHLTAYIIALSVSGLQAVILPETLLIPGSMDAVLLLIGMATGLLASFTPSLSAGRTDIATLLAKGHL